MYSHTRTGRPPTRAQHGLITSPHYLASSTGVDILRAGGSAVDAAIAANATLCVVYPHMAGLGGDGFWLISSNDADADVKAINASGPAAEAATRDYYADLGYDEIPERGSASALTVPGAVDGWRLAHEKHGKLPWDRLFEDAITYASEGVAMTDDFTRWIALDADVLGEQSMAAETFLNDGSAPDPGTLLSQPDLADSLESIAALGPREGFYEGPVAEAFCQGLGEESPLSTTDLAEYTADWVEPLSVDYRGYTAHSLPPNTQGIAALQLLGLLDGFDVDSWGDGTADYYHHMSEAVKVAFADRDAWVTDPDVVDMPAERLLSAVYLDERRELIAPDSSLPAAVEPGLTSEGVTLQPQDPGGDTCYLSVVDDDGLAVSMIQSIYFDFGSGMVAGETGIIPQNRGSFFSLEASHVNSLEPGKRTFHTLIPSMLTRDGEPWLVYGTMGGEGQPQTQAALVSRIVDFGYDVQEAIEAPRWLFGRTWGDESKSLSLEGRVPDGVVSELERRGQPIAMARDFDDTMGHAAAIRLYDDGTLEGGADPRGDGAAIGY
jgi:gamma-glutamyltranspeptidase/glutathione hydrolase